MAAEIPVIGELKAHALEYAAAGLEVFPVHGPTKQPMAAHARGAPSQYGATTDADTVARWWDTWPEALIGHRLPEDQVVIDVDPRHGGDATWKALAAEFGFEPSGTRVHLSGRDDGGGHATFQRPPGRLTISKLDAWAKERGVGHEIAGPTDRWVCGLDLLHRTHRYTILPPSPHPETGKPYRWHQWREPEPMPPALAALLIDAAPPRPPAVAKHYEGESIADWYSTVKSWNDILPRAGWTLRAGDGDSDGSQWRHPTATSPISATVRNDCLFVYSPNTPFDVTSPDDPHGVTRFRAFTVLEHRGDASGAARAAREMKDGPRVSSTSPAPSSSTPPPVAQDGQLPEVSNSLIEATPQIVFYADEVAKNPPPPVDDLVTNLVAVGEVTVFGAPRAMGKTWATMALGAAVSEGAGTMFGSDRLKVTKPGNVVYMQGELGLSASHTRWMLASNGTPPHVAEVFERMRVRTTKRTIEQAADGMRWRDEESVATVDHRLEPLLTELDCDLLILDPWATYYAGKENDNDETEAAIDAITQMARRVGCAVWIVHHISAKTQHSQLAEPEDLWRGASRLADAVSTRVTMLPHFDPKKAKELGLDRFQARRFADLHVLQRNGPPVPVIHTQLNRFAWEAWEPPAPDPGGRPEALTEQDVIRAMRQSGGEVPSTQKFEDATGRSYGAVKRVLDQLVQKGAVEKVAGPRNSVGYRLVEGKLP